MEYWSRTARYPELKHSTTSLLHHSITPSLQPTAMKLSGKVALVTGSARGLGRAYALRLADLGADVVINDIRLDAFREFDEEIGAETVMAEVEARGVRSLGIEADVTKKNDVDRMVGRQNIHCAGRRTGECLQDKSPQKSLRQWAYCVNRQLCRPIRSWVSYQRNAKRSMPFSGSLIGTELDLAVFSPRPRRKRSAPGQPSSPTPSC